MELRGTLPYEEVPTWIRSGRIGLVPLLPLPKFMKNISTKTFEYWACGLPVIASNLVPIRPFLTDGYNGVLFEPGSARDSARAIRSLLAAPAQSEAMGRNGQQQVYEIWNNDSQTVDLLVSMNNSVKDNISCWTARSKTRCPFRKSDASRTSCLRQQASSPHAPRLLDSRFRGHDTRPQGLAV